MFSECSDISDNEMDLNDQIIRQLKNIHIDRKNNEATDIISQNLVKDFNYDYCRGIINIQLVDDAGINDEINRQLLEIGWINTVRITIQGESNCNQFVLEKKKNEILSSLKKVIDPDLNKDIVSCGFVKDLNIDLKSFKVSFTLELTTPICPLKSFFERSCVEIIKNEREYVKEVNISFAFRPVKKIESISKEKMHTNLKNVSNIIAISSCKGGVGKSTIAVNIAFSLNRLGAKVGLVDCDLYGPNLEQLVPLESNTVYYKKSNDTEELEINVTKRGLSKRKGMNIPNDQSREGFVPLVYKGVQLISYSYLTNSTRGNNVSKVSSIIRGPIAGSIATQLITGTLWDDLDYLVLDLPPGTGDIPLTIAQTIEIDGAIIITTPQDLSIADVERGIHLFNKLSIPILTVVENMSYFICDGCDKKHEIFSKGDFSLITEKYGLECNFIFPLFPNLSKCIFSSNSNDTDFPYINVADTNDRVYIEFLKLSEYIVRKLSKNRYSDNKPKFEFDNNKKLAHFQIPQDIKDVPAQVNAIINSPTSCSASYDDIRKLCRCAICYGPGRTLTNMPGLSTLSIDQLETMGSYAISIVWSDGHNSIISYSNLVKNFGGKNGIRLCQNESLIW
ncbi:MRP like MinD-like ATPase [Cryptosporidium canis]|uniref:MRP like MinD-like ATPase n=1 Tax=Cryptosporidium canis TaxID=195482 RepID=A0A9D5DIM4_9CRYT|nr:MRP like MinD-like ATPase [Cryptosporidium canis]